MNPQAVYEFAKKDFETICQRDQEEYYKMAFEKQSDYPEWLENMHQATLRWHHILLAHGVARIEDALLKKNTQILILRIDQRLNFTHHFSKARHIKQDASHEQMTIYLEHKREVRTNQQRFLFEDEESTIPAP
jgi:hypothetical protein